MQFCTTNEEKKAFYDLNSCNPWFIVRFRNYLKTTLLAILYINTSIKTLLRCLQYVLHIYQLIYLDNQIKYTNVILKM